MKPFWLTKKKPQSQEQREALIIGAVSLGLKREDAEKLADEDDPFYTNDKYNVFVEEEGEFIHLSIVRVDKEAIHDWRDMQKIKSMIIGEENEACELYPAESRLVDTANTYHLWVIKDPKIRFPFGFNDGRRVNDTPPEESKVKQRKF